MQNTFILGVICVCLSWFICVFVCVYLSPPPPPSIFFPDYLCLFLILLAVLSFRLLPSTLWSVHTTSTSSSSSAALSSSLQQRSLSKSRLLPPLPFIPSLETVFLQGKNSTAHFVSLSASLYALLRPSLFFYPLSFTPFHNTIGFRTHLLKIPICPACLSVAFSHLITVGFFFPGCGSEEAKEEK